MGVELMLKNGTGPVVLEVCRGAWAMQALKEREAMKALKALENNMTSDLQKLKPNCNARLSVAGAASLAVSQMNDKETGYFLAKCNHQRQQLVDFMAWEFRQLLAIQQIFSLRWVCLASTVPWWTHPLFQYKQKYAP